MKWKVFDKWLVYGMKDGHKRIVTSFHTKKQAVEELNKNFKNTGDDEWEDVFGEVFTIAKNTVEFE